MFQVTSVDLIMIKTAFPMSILRIPKLEKDMPINLQILLVCMLNRHLLCACSACVDKRLTIPFKRASVNLLNKQGPRRQQRHLKTKLRASAIIS